MPVTIGNLRATWANSLITYTGIGLNINATSYDVNSALLDLKLNSNSLIKLTSNGVLYVNGYPIGVSSNTNVGPAFDKANTANDIAVSAFIAANAAGGTGISAAFDKANSANIIASQAFDKANSANVLAYNTGLGTNAFAAATIAGANTAVGTGANNYLLAVIAGSNTAVGTGANNYLLAVIAGSNTAVGGGANAYAASIANTIAILAFDRANTTNLVPVGNTLTNSFTLRSTRNKLNFIQGTNVTINVDDDSAGDRANITISATAGSDPVAQLAFDKANAALPNTSGISFAGYLNFSTGNVGIGVSNATLSKLETVGGAGVTAAIFGSNSTGVSMISSWPTVAFNSYYSGGFKSLATGYGGYIQVTQNSGDMLFALANTVTGTSNTQSMSERVRITNDGKVGIGTSSPTSNLHVVGTANITNTLTVAGSNVFAVNVQTFTTSGTWTKPTGFGGNSQVFIQGWGGGGSGARGTANNGSGGGGGGYNYTWEKLSDLGATETVTIGLGGASRTTATFYQPGAVGGTSSFGTWLYAYGGGGGSNSRPSTGYTFGGSGGGQTSAGGTATNFNDPTGNPGGPLIVRSATYSGASPTLILFYQGHGKVLQDSDATAYVGPFEAYMHGGGGGGGGGTGQPSTRQGGTSVWGGGGGGANNSNGGISIYGGNGGNGKSTSAEATAGIEPGGGGGGSNTASGAGANGRIIVTVFAGSA